MLVSVRRWAVALALLLCPASALAQSQTVPRLDNWATANGANFVLPAARVNLGVFNIADLGADTTGSVDASSIISAAISTAPAVGGTGQVWCPNGSYKIASTITWTTANINFRGYERNGCVFFPTVTGDTIYIAPSPLSPYLASASIENVRIVRTDNPSSGACLRMNELQAGSFTHIELDGCFYNLQIQSTLNTVFTDLLVQGSNTASGASLVILNRSSGSNPHNSSNKFLGAEIRGTGSVTYTNGLVVQDSDGFQVSNSHIGFVSGKALYLVPANANDDIDNVLLDNTILDTAGTGLACDSIPSGFSAHFFNNALTGGSSIQNMTQNGVNIASTCTVMSDLNLSGTQFLNNFASQAIINAGSYYQLQGAVFNEANGNNASNPQVSIGGTASHVNLDGAQYLLGNGTFQANYNLVLGGSADYISATNQDFSGAATGDYSNGSSGTHITVTTAATDQASPTFVFAYGGQMLTGLSSPGTSTIKGATVAASTGLFVNGTSAMAIGGVTPYENVFSTTDTIAAAWNQFTADTSGADIGCLKSRNTTPGSHTIVVSGDTLCSWEVFADATTGYPEVGNLTWSALGTVSSGVVPTQAFLQAANSSGTLTTMMSWNGNSNKVTVPGTFVNSGIASTAQADVVCTTSAGTFSYQVSGTGCASSGEQFKNILALLSPRDALVGVMKMQAKIYTYKDTADYGDKEFVSLTAQNACTVDERICARDAKGVPVNYDKYGALAYAIGAIKAQQQEIERLQRRIAR